MALACQTFANFNQRDIPLLVDPGQNRGSVGLNAMTAAVTANGIWFNTASTLIALMPTHRRRNGNIKLRRSSTARKASFDSQNNTKAKVINTKANGGRPGRGGAARGRESIQGTRNDYGRRRGRQ